MMMRRLIAVLFFCFPMAYASAQNAAPGLTLTLAQFQAQLEQLNSQVSELETQPQNAEALRTSLPKQWTVTGGSPAKNVDVSAAAIDQALTDFQKEGPSLKKNTLRQLHTQLLAMRAEADGFIQTEATDAAMRKRLDNILAAREFGGVQGPSYWDTLLDRLNGWLSKLWDKLFGNLHITPPNVEWVGRIFVWVVICMASCALAVWLFRIYRRKPEEYRREILPFAPSAKSWRIWLVEAREKAAGNDWRSAIHLAYWASVSYLEASGLWVPDRARTPREYLGAVDGRDPKKQPFTALTRRFESVWYGTRQADATDFDATLAELEKLGCR